MRLIPGNRPPLGAGASSGTAIASPLAEPLVRGLDALVAVVRSTPFLALALVVVTWPISVRLAWGEVDASWQVALVMALERGLQFGPDFVFTYGPLGFLHVPEVFGEGLWLVAFAYATLIRIGLAISLLWVGRRALPLPLALAVCFLVLAAGPWYTATVFLVFLWAFVAVAPDPPRFALPLVLYGGGFLAAVELLAKFNFGISITAVAVVALLAVPGRRVNLARFAAVFVVSLLCLWLLSGQALSNLPDFLSNSLQMATGYSQAMAIDIEPTSGEVILALATVAVVVFWILVAGRDQPWRRRVLASAAFLLFAYFSFKQDFVRRGLGGRIDFAFLMTAAALIAAARFPVRIRRPGLRMLPPVLASALLVPMLALVVWAAGGRDLRFSIDPGEHIQAFRQDIHLASSPGALAAARESARVGDRAGSQLPRSILARIGDRSVAIEPWEAGIAWGYGLNWKPLPVIQDYAAYTSKLDGLNAAALSNGDGPEVILRQSTRSGPLPTTLPIVADRYPGWDSPAANVALLCNYRSALAGGEYQVVERTAPRCGPPRLVATVAATSGSPVAVPSPPGSDQIVVARLHRVGLDATESALSVLYRAPHRSISWPGGRSWNLPPTTAADGMLMRAPAWFDYPGPFHIAPDMRSFTVDIDGAAGRRFEVEFLAERVRD